jgi:Cu/Ag efflux protein CusF
MHRLSSNRSQGPQATLVLLLAALGAIGGSAGPLAAQPAGAPPIEGVITVVQIKDAPQVLKVRTKSGDEIQATIGERTQVSFTDGARGFSEEPKLGDLRPGMTVQFTPDAEMVKAVRVIAVPLAIVAERNKAAAATGGGPRTGELRMVKGRLKQVDAARAEIRADVAGREESFRVADKAALRGFHQGEDVILTVASDGTVSSIHLAALTGKVTRVDDARNRVVMDVGGRPQTYGVENRELLTRLRVGQTVRFEVEPRGGGVKVLTAVF